MVACPACRAENPDRAKFCMECAAPLAAPSLICEERKVVTTLFCDLVAFTAMSEAADPEDVDRLLGDYFARATKVIESHGGTVEKFIGDAVVGVFGVPVVHEDDPERAVRAGLRIMRALEGMTRPDGPQLEARVGINTGEALVRLDVDPASGRGFLTGDAVNTAARLQAAAPPDGVAVGALTHELTQRAMVYEELPPVTAKGKAEPVAAWRAVAPVARTGADLDREQLTPLVGRDVEVALLHALLGKAVESSAPQFVLLLGEPGIGKTRLVHELFAEVDGRPELISWRQGRCPSYGEAVAFWPVAEIVKAHAGILDTDSRGVLEEKLEAVLPAGEDREWFGQRLGALLGLEAAQAEREENFTAWLRFLEEVVAAEPAVLIFEDLHWADDSMLAFLEFMAERVARVPLLVVATARPELFEAHPQFAAGARVNRVVLESLSRKDSEALVASLLGDLDDNTAPAIVDSAEGNPFYAEESARLVHERAGGAVRSVTEALLTGSVQAVIAARLDALPAEQKAVLADASVAGEVFWSGLVTEMSARSAEDIEGALAGLMARRLVRRVRGSSMVGEREYTFAHALARDVAYGQLPRTEKARRHVATAAWLEGKVGERADEFAEVIAGHFDAALSIAVALGDEERAAERRQKAVAHLIVAAERAALIDSVALRRCCSRGLELADADSPERRRLLRNWAQVLTTENHYREAADLLQDLIPSLLDSGDRRSAARAMSQLAVARSLMGESGFDLSTEAVHVLEGDGPSRELVEALASLAASMSMRPHARPEEVIEIADRALAMNAHLGLRLSAVPLSWRGSARIDLGDLGGIDDYGQALTDARELGQGDNVAMILFNRSTLDFAIRGPVAALEMQKEGLDFSLHRGIDYFALAFRALLVETLGNLGEWTRALEQAAEVQPDLERAEDTIDLLLVRSHLSLILSRTGRVDEAAPWFTWLSETGRATDIVFLKTYAMLATAEVQMTTGQGDAALAMLREWVWLTPIYSEPAWFAFVPGAVRTALTCGDAGLAQRIARSFEPNLPLQEHARTVACACLAEARAEREAAAVGFAAGAAGWHDFGMPYEEAQALLGQGRCLVALGRRQEAAAPLAGAREIFARLGAKPALAEVAQLLDEITPAPH